MKNTCSIDGCNSDARIFGYCAMHGRRWKKHGDPLLGGKERKPCTIDGCNSATFGHGLCNMHYKRWKKHGDPRKVVRVRLPNRYCSVDGCHESHYGHTWCRKHYDRWREHGDPSFIKADRTCSIDGCGKMHEAHGWCNMHYQRWRNNGDPLLTKIAPMGCEHIDKDGYRQIRVDGRYRREHRVVMERKIGRPLLREEDVHHINHDKLDNRPENLMVLPHGQHTRLHHLKKRATD